MKGNEASGLLEENLKIKHFRYQENPQVYTPIRDDAFELSDEEKIDQISKHFEEIMITLGLDLKDDSLQGTPRRVAKMYVKEIFRGLNPKNAPSITLFDNKYQYRQMLVEKEIPLQTTCEHHFLPIVGKVHIGYFPKDKVVGLSKLNRIVEHFGRRPQVQERLTMEIAQELQEKLQTEDVAVIIDAEHMCVSCRGVQHQGASTYTSEFRGKFINSRIRDEFWDSIRK